MAGLSSARSRGRLGGRKPGLSEDAQKKAKAVKILFEQGQSANEIAKSLGISRATCYRYVRI